MFEKYQMKFFEKARNMEIFMLEYFEMLKIYESIGEFSNSKFEC